MFIGQTVPRWKYMKIGAGQYVHRQTVPRRKYMKISAGQYIHRTNGSKMEIYEDWCRTICS
jgi:hypothetical protein